TYSSQASGSGDGVYIPSKVPDEQVHEKTGIDEGDGDKTEVPNVPEHYSSSEEESWTFSDGDDDDEDDDANKDSDAHDDDDDDDDVTKSDDDEEQEEDEEDISDQLVRTPSDYQTPDESEKQKDDDRVKDDLVAKFISPTMDEGIDSILTPHTESTTLVNVHISVATETPATTTIIHPPLFSVIQSSQQTPVTTTTTTNPSTTPLPIPN
ncbi:hypothetical protein Tco_0191954, partial [Tanacetum coccineum]